MDAHRATAISGADSNRISGTRSGNNLELPAIACRMRNGDECFSECSANFGFAGAQAAFAFTGPQYQTCCGGSTIGRPLDCGGSNVSDIYVKRETRDAVSQGIAESGN